MDRLKKVAALLFGGYLVVKEVWEGFSAEPIFPTGTGTMATFLAFVTDWLPFVAGAALILWVIGPPIVKRVRKFKRITAQTFTNQTIRLDGFVYQDCTFHDCSFRWDGAPFNVINCKITGSRHFSTRDNNITLAVDVMKALGFLGAEFASSWQHKPKEYLEV